MVTKRTRTLAPAWLTCLSILLLSLACTDANEGSPSPTLNRDIEAAATIASCTFYLEVADTPQKRARGLMERESLGKDRGMLFVFQSEQVLSFWMRNTLIPLDILFIDENLAVVDVQTMQPEREAAGGALPIHTSASPALYAIEINEAMAAQCGIEPGASVVLREIAPEAGQ